MSPPDRKYCRLNDIGPEGGIILAPGDKEEREESYFREWLQGVESKVDKIMNDGCSHRGNDLAKLARIESSTDGFRNEASAIKNSIFELSLSFANYKTEVLQSTHKSDNKINNLKIGILVQCALLLVAVLAFVFKEFVIPATKNQPHMNFSSEYQGRPQVTIDIETWNKMVKEEMNKNKK